ncbi:MAG: hypothetical protein JGK24_30365 [Microcoleus sp. PH2017_29_MFU_D_A]|uniref:hypothetical protein n=1 Tax=Microcoleus sp. PH2017_29_MFU_D_A TaxID=2798839 RepID=UPI001DCD8CF0|nr:hypothetical protein [Microcoleus sp. PH2017_29_MFU_D_A]MCC3607415.1 hypothetical protein [Microcoleus sp. PH2017_29_MFU_D_A]
MLNDFIHVDCSLTRAVLNGDRTGIKAILRAARFSDACQSEDYKSNHITDCVYSARETAIANMWLELEAGNHAAAVDAMRSFWSV